MTGKNKFMTLFSVFLLSSLLVTGAVASEGEKPTVDASMTFYSQYIWRAQELSQDSLVIFPEITVSYKGFGFTLWGDFDTDYAGDNTGNNKTEWWETDMVLTYSNSFDKLNYTLGWIYYDVDSGDDEELYLILGYDTLLSPEISVWRGIEYGASWYINMALSHSFEFENGHSLDLGANAGWWNHPGGDHDIGGWNDFNISAGYNIPINEWCTITPSINYTTTLSSPMQDWIESISFDGDDHDYFYGGVSLAISF